MKTMQYPESSQSFDGDERPWREPVTIEETREYLLYLQANDPFTLRQYIRETLLMLNQAPANRIDAALQKPGNITGNESFALGQRLKKIRGIVEQIWHDIKNINDGETRKAEVYVLPVTHGRFFNPSDRMP